MAQRRQLPVEHGDDARLGGVEHHVLQPVVAVGDGHVVAARSRRQFGQARRQLGHQPLHRRNGFRLRATVLLDPAVDLAAEVVAGLAIVGQADGGHVDLVQPRQRGVQVVVDGGALGRRHAGQAGVAEDAAFQEVHHVERRADDAVVLAQRPHRRHRKADAAQRLHHAELAVDLVRAGQQRAGRLLAQHPALRAGCQQIRGIGRTALELAELQRLGRVGDVGAEPALQLGLVQALVVAHRTDGRAAGVVDHGAAHRHASCARARPGMGQSSMAISLPLPESVT